MVFTIMENLNGIKSLKEEHDINDAASLVRDRDVKDSLCFKALQVYEAFFVWKHPDIPPQFRNNRAQLAHFTGGLRNNDLVGFDEIEPDELWHKNFESALPEIENEVDQVFRAKPKLWEAVQNLSTNEVALPRRLLGTTDFSHLRIIKEIQDKWKDVAMCSVALLHLMSQGTAPPPFEKFVRYVEVLVGGTREEIGHAIQPLVDRNILSRSSSERFLFVEDRGFARSVTLDFLEHNDLEVIFETIRRLENDD